MKALKTVLPTLRLWPFDAPAAFQYARIYGELANLGRLIGEFDMLIAAVALALGKCTVVSADGDFSAVPGLSVENWRS